MTATLIWMLLVTQAPEQSGAVVPLSNRTGASTAVATRVARDLRTVLSQAEIGAPVANDALAPRLAALDAPRLTAPVSLVPQGAAARPERVAFKPPSRVPVYVTGGIAVLGLGATLFFAATGFAEKSALDKRLDLGSGLMGSSFTRDDAAATANSVNVRLAVALACGAGSVAFATMAAIFHAASGPDYDTSK